GLAVAKKVLPVSQNLVFADGPVVLRAGVPKQWENVREQFVVDPSDISRARLDGIHARRNRIVFCLQGQHPIEPVNDRRIYPRDDERVARFVDSDFLADGLPSHSARKVNELQEAFLSAWRS